MTESLIEVRPATPADAEEMASVRVAAWRAAYQGLMPHTVLESLDPLMHADRFEKSLRIGSVVGYVATSDKKVIAFVLLSSSRDEGASESTGEIPLFYIVPEWWRRQIGTDLWGHVLELAGSRGFQDLTLWVMEDNVRARRFYERCGFRPDGAVKTDLELAHTPIREIRYRRRVDGHESTSHGI